MRLPRPERLDSESSGRLPSSKSTASSFSRAGAKTATPPPRQLFRRHEPSIPKIAVAKNLAREQIRAARMAPLVPLLQKGGLQLTKKHADNFELSAFPGLIVNQSYWRWPGHNLEGNAIPLPQRYAPNHRALIPAVRTTAVQPALAKSSKNQPYDANAAKPLKSLIPRQLVRPERGQHQSNPEKLRRTMPPWTKSATPEVALSNRPALSQPYDQSVAIRPTFTTTGRSARQNPCDFNFAKSTLTKKSATVNRFVITG